MLLVTRVGKYGYLFNELSNGMMSGQGVDVAISPQLAEPFISSKTTNTRDKYI
jgi:hypothetical protein